MNDLRDIVITPDVIRDSIAHLNEGNLMVSDSVQIMSFVHPFHWNSFLHPYFLLVFVRDMYIPAAFQDAIVQHILKGVDKDPSLSSNYRGIALASSFSKLMECVQF